VFSTSQLAADASGNFTALQDIRRRRTLDDDPQFRLKRAAISLSSGLQQLDRSLIQIAN
jgi:hypothetical protein